jgi:hypothetical protein
MIKPYNLHKLLGAKEFVPQAIVGVNVSYFADRFKSELVKEHDDLDEFLGTAFWLDEWLPFTVMHYRGHPPDTSTIYLPFEITDVEKITGIVERIASEFKVTDKVLWQRKNDPEL